MTELAAWGAGGPAAHGVRLGGGGGCEGGSTPVAREPRLHRWGAADAELGGTDSASCALWRRCNGPLSPPRLARFRGAARGS